VTGLKVPGSRLRKFAIGLGYRTAIRSLRLGVPRKSAAAPQLSGTQAQKRFRSPQTLSMRPTAGQNLCSRSQGAG